MAPCHNAAREGLIAGALCATSVPIGIGNLLAAGAMGTYLWRTHPELGSEFAHALGGAE